MNGPDNKIGWCDFTANPVRGKCLYNCPNCYAELIRKRYKWPEGIVYKANWFDAGQVRRFIKKRGREPIIFVGSMHDIFGDWIPASQIKHWLDVCREHPEAHFAFLTKNPERYAKLDWPENCWAGTTITQQKDERRIAELLRARAKVRFVSFEPLLENIDASEYIRWIDRIEDNELDEYGQLIDWVIIGCESGPKRRPCKLEWVRDLVQQCKAADVPVFIKQILIGEYTSETIYKSWVSKNPADWPEDLRIREFPERR